MIYPFLVPAQNCADVYVQHRGWRDEPPVATQRMPPTTIAGRPCRAAPLVSGVPFVENRDKAAETIPTRRVTNRPSRRCSWRHGRHRSASWSPGPDRPLSPIGPLARSRCPGYRASVSLCRGRPHVADHEDCRSRCRTRRPIRTGTFPCVKEHASSTAADHFAGQPEFEVTVAQSVDDFDDDAAQHAVSGARPTVSGTGYPCIHQQPSWKPGSP